MLCWIKKSLRPENQGLVIETSQYLGYFQRGERLLVMGEYYHAFDTDHHWLINSKHGMISTQYGASQVGYSPESWLVPILPDANNLGLTNETNNDWILTKETENA